MKKEAKIEGLSGWLIIPILNLFVVAFLYVGIALMLLLESLELALIYAFIGAFTIYVIIMMFQKKKIFPKLFVGWLWITFAFGLILTIIEPTEDMFFTIFGELIFLIIWTSYMYKSVRVKNTFVK